MSLTNINPGDEADATILMANFNDLDERMSGFDSDIATVNASINSLNTNINNTINNLGNTYVKLTTSQTISGNKTFSGTTVHSGATTMSGNVTISGGSFTFTRCTTTPGTSSTASNSKVAVVVKNYLSGYNWFRLWSDGFCEQGGYVSSAFSGSKDIGLIKTLPNTNYTALITIRATAGNRYAAHIVSLSKTAISVYVPQSSYMYWCAYGFAS